MRWRIAVPAVIGGAVVTLATALAVAPQAVVPLLPVSPDALLLSADRLPSVLAAVVGVYAGWVALSYRLSDASTPLQTAEDATQSPADAAASVDADDDATAHDSPMADSPESAADESSTAQSITVGGKTLVRFGDGAETAAEGGATSDTVSEPERAAADPLDDGQSRAVDTGASRRELGKESRGAPNGEQTNAGVPPERFDAFRRLPPEEPRERDATVVGEEFDRSVAEQEAVMGDTWPYEEEHVRDRLEETLVAVDERSNRRTRAEIQRAIERGTWTDDPVAAAFLSADESVSPPLRERIRAWLAPRQAFSRAVDSTVDAIERRSEEGGKR